jgi:putative hydrolase of the HAD superfamily
VEDEDEFAAAVASGRYPQEVARQARIACDDLTATLYEEPFRSVGDAWLARVPSRFDAAILLDMGGVLDRGGSGTARQEWERKLGLEHGGLQRVFSKAIGPGWEGGRSMEQICWTLRAELGLDHAALWNLRVALMADGTLDETLLELLAARSSTTAAAVVSNNGADIRQVWEAAFDINTVVDLLVISGEERVAKPSADIYRIACGRLGVPPQRCVFVDDTEEHVAAASELGMRAIQHSAERPAYAAIELAVDSLGTREPGLSSTPKP